MRVWLLIFVGLILVACGGEELAPTNAPIIPPTRTATLPPSQTPRPFQTIAATADLNLPTWTATLSATPAPTRTLAPSLTPRPSLTPIPTLSTGLGTGQLLLGAQDLSRRFTNTPFKTQFRLEPPFMRLSFTLRNEFLGQDSQIEAQVSPQMEAGELTLNLIRFQSQGALVTETQVQEALQAMQPQLNQFIRSFESESQWEELEILQGFLRLSIGN